MLTVVRPTAAASPAPGGLLDPLPRALDPEYACQEAAASFNAHKADGPDEEEEDAEEEEEEKKEAQNLTERLELLTCEPADGIRRLREVMNEHEKQHPPAANTNKKEGRFPKAVRLQMQIQASKLPEMGGGPLLLSRPLPDAIGSEPTPEGDVIGEALARQCARLQKEVDSTMKLMITNPVQGAEKNKKLALALPLVERAAKRQVLAQQVRAQVAKREAAQFDDVDALFAQADAAREEAGYEAPPPPQRSASAELDGLAASTMRAEPMTVSASGGAEAMVVDFAHQQHLFGAVDFKQAEAERKQQMAKLGIDPSLCDPVATLAGSHIESDTACRQCPVPSQAEYTAETLNEMLLFRGPNDVPLTAEDVPLRTYNPGEFVNTVGEAFLNEKHRFEAADSPAIRATAVERALTSVQSNVVFATPADRVKSLLFCANPRCRQRAGRWPRTAQGCWLMKQHGRFNPRAEQDLTRALPAIDLNKDRFGTVRHTAFYLLKNDMRVLHLLFCLGGMTNGHVVDMAQFVLNYSHWFAERERKTLAFAWHMMRHHASFGFSVPDPNDFVAKCGAVFLDFAFDTLQRLIAGMELPARHGELGAATALPAMNAPLAYDDVATPMAALEARMKTAFIGNLPTPVDIGFRVRSWYILSGTIVPHPADADAAGTLLSLRAFVATHQALASKQNQRNGRTFAHVRMSTARPGTEGHGAGSISVVPRALAQQLGFDAAEALKTMRRAGRADSGRIFASVSRGVPSLREAGTDLTARPQQQCLDRQWIVSCALARLSAPGGQPVLDAALEIQSGVVHDECTVVADEQPATMVGHFRPPALEQIIANAALTVMQRREALEGTPEARAPGLALKGDAYTALANPELRAQLATSRWLGTRSRKRTAAAAEAAPSSQPSQQVAAAAAPQQQQQAAAEPPPEPEPWQDGSFAERARRLDDALGALLVPEMSEAAGLARLRWNGGTRGTPEFELLVDDSRRCLLYAGDPAEGLSAVDDVGGMMAWLLGALAQLRAIGTEYGLRWKEQARLRGATVAAAYARPLADYSGNGLWDLDAAARAGAVLSVLSDALENLDAATQPFADDPERRDADEALTGGEHDSLQYVFPDAERRQRFGHTLRAGNYLLGRVARAVAAEAVQLEGEAEHEAAVDRLVDVDKRLPSRRLASLRLQFHHGTSDERGAIGDFLNRALAYLARFYAARVLAPQAAHAKASAALAEIQSELDRDLQEQARLVAAPDAPHAQLQQVNLAVKTNAGKVKKRTGQVGALAKRLATDEARLCRILTEVRMVQLADETQLPPLDGGSSAADPSDAKHKVDTLAEQFDRYRLRLAAPPAPASALPLTASDWPLDPRAPVDESDELVRALAGALRATAVQADGARLLQLVGAQVRQGHDAKHFDAAVQAVARAFGKDRSQPTDSVLVPDVAAAAAADEAAEEQARAAAAAAARAALPVCTPQEQEMRRIVASADAAAGSHGRSIDEVLAALCAAGPSASGAALSDAEDDDDESGGGGGGGGGADHLPVAAGEAANGPHGLAAQLAREAEAQARDRDAKSSARKRRLAPSAARDGAGKRLAIDASAAAAIDCTSAAHAAAVGGFYAMAAQLEAEEAEAAEAAA